jgi:hypothetical protein
LVGYLPSEYFEGYSVFCGSGRGRCIVYPTENYEYRYKKYCVYGNPEKRASEKSQ